MAAPGGKDDLYRVLGVERTADADAIRKAYRKLARRHHPDVNPGDPEAEERFKQVTHAHAVLSDPERRRAYDEFGDVSLEAGFDPEKAREARDAFGRQFGDGGSFDGRSGGGEQTFHFGGLEDLFEDLFSRRGWSEAPRQRGPDLELELPLDFLEAVRGGERRFSFSRPAAEGGLEQETVTVRIPAGVSEGGRLRVRGEGDAGDLHVRIRIRPHRFFRREGRDVSFDLPLTVREATLGAKVRVPTLDGSATLTVPPGTDSGTRLRLRGKGVPNPGGGPAGDLYAVTQIRVPRDPSPELCDALRANGDEDASVREELFQ